MTDYIIAVVKDTLDVLSLIGAAPHGLSLTELVERTSLGKNKVFRILHTLQDSQMLYKDEHGKYHPGLRITALAQHVKVHDVLIDMCNPIMDELLENTQESIFLGVVLGKNALCIAARESTRSMRLFAQVGIQSPLYMGGVPKVLLAYMDSHEREHLLAYFEKTVTDVDKIVDWQALRGRLAKIRSQGYSVIVDELDKGAHSITAPIFDSRGQVLAAMSIAGPSVRFPQDTIEHYIALITEATQSISAQLDYQSYSVNGASDMQKALTELT